jgi:iron complex outermembrane receptor protein
MPMAAGNILLFIPPLVHHFIFSELLKNKSAFDFLSYGQLRASYGITGKDYNAYDLNRIGNYALGGTDEIVTNGQGVTTIPHVGFTDQDCLVRTLRMSKQKNLRWVLI